MTITATAPRIFPYFSTLASAADRLVGAIFLIKASELAARLLNELRKSATLDAGEKL